MQMPKNTAQQYWISHALYIFGPIQIIRLPMAVAPSHRPWHKPTMLRGATLLTKLKPSGEMNNSATVRKKYVTISTHGPALVKPAAAISAESMARNASPEG